MPATYTDKMMIMPLPQIQSKVYEIFQNMGDVSNTRACQAIAKFEGNLLIIIAEKDDIVPLAITSKYYDIANKTHKRAKVIIKESLHVLEKAEWKKQFHDEVIRWFEQTL